MSVTCFRFVNIDLYQLRFLWDLYKQSYKTLWKIVETNHATILLTTLLINRTQSNDAPFPISTRYHWFRSGILPACSYNSANSGIWHRSDQAKPSHHDTASLLPYIRCSRELASGVVAYLLRYNGSIGAYTPACGLNPRDRTHPPRQILDKLSPVYRYIYRVHSLIHVSPTPYNFAHEQTKKKYVD